jgi:hypothetical protein
MTTYFGNAFSPNMLDVMPADVRLTEISAAVAAEYVLAGVQHAVGQASTAAVFSDVLGVAVPANRATVTLEAGDKLVFGQYRGPRLEEGVTTLPEGATIQWLLAQIG